MGKNHLKSLPRVTFGEKSEEEMIISPANLQIKNAGKKYHPLKKNHKGGKKI